jgi:hypothetical protein
MLAELFYGKVLGGWHQYLEITVRPYFLVIIFCHEFFQDPVAVNIRRV